MLTRILVALLTVIPLTLIGAKRYVGGDISLLPEYENAGAKYLTHDGKPIADLLPWLHDQGMNAMRVRLFVNPDEYKKLHPESATGDLHYDPNACQSFEYIRPLCRKIVDNGMDLMLDFHYSDTWADPTAQWTPVDWEGLDDDQLCQKIYDYTRETLLELRADGVVPAFIQPGNEISFGMLWGAAGTSDPLKTLYGSDANWDRLGRLLTNAIRACREVCPEAKIVIHTERIAQPDVARNFYEQMKRMNIDYDIIGLSYYPYFHGDLDKLTESLDMLGANFADKDIMIVETGYSYKWAVPGSNFDHTAVWPYSDAGQDLFARQLVETLERYDYVNGLFWWWMEYNAYGTDLTGWYNAPLFDSTTGRACQALTTICSYARGGDALTPARTDTRDDSRWFDFGGRQLQSHPEKPGVYLSGDGTKVIVR